MPTKVTDVEPATLKQWLNEGKVLLIDVREPTEYQEENIPEAQLLPLSQFKPDQVPQMADKIVVFHCARGGRSFKAAQKWSEAVNREAYNLKGGINAWKDLGYPTEYEIAVSSNIFQKTYLVAGAAVILLSLLALIHPSFILLSLVLGAALIFFGTAGTDWLTYLWGKIDSSKK